MKELKSKIRSLEIEIEKMEYDYKWMEQNGTAGNRVDELTSEFLIDNINEAKDILDSKKREYKYKNR